MLPPVTFSLSPAMQSFFLFGGALREKHLAFHCGFVRTMKKLSVCPYISNTFVIAMYWCKEFFDYWHSPI